MNKTVTKCYYFAGIGLDVRLQAVLDDAGVDEPNDLCGRISAYMLRSKSDTVKTLYNVTRYNRIFNIRHKFAGNGSVSIKIPSL